MKIKLRPLYQRKTAQRDSRRGAGAVLAAAMLIAVMAFTAFTVDFGYITLSKAQLQNGADSAALAAVLELPKAWGPGGWASSSEADDDARQAAVEIAASNRSADAPQLYVAPDRDVQFGNYAWDSHSGEWVKNWGSTPYNMVRVNLSRDVATNSDGTPNSGGDRPLDLFFAPVMGHDTAGLAVSATAAFRPGVGFRIAANSSANADILPIALDNGTWNALLAGVGSDKFTYNPATGAVTNGPDGILEVNLYPEGNHDLPPGNRGTVDIGSANNSTSDLSRQILYGVNADDLSYFGGEIRTDLGPLYINGDTGLSAGIKDELEAIKGQSRVIPIFTDVSGPGNNATYTVIKFVGIRVMSVRLTGSPNHKHVTIQPAPYYGAEVIPGSVTITADTIFTKPKLIP